MLEDIEKEVFKDGVTKEAAKVLEGETLAVVSFTNTTGDVFEPMWGGKTRKIGAGETIFVPRFLAEQYAKQLADMLLLRGDNLSDELGRARIYAQCLAEPVRQTEASSVATPPVVAPEPEFADIKKEATPKVSKTYNQTATKPGRPKKV